MCFSWSDLSEKIFRCGVFLRFMHTKVHTRSSFFRCGYDIYQHFSRFIELVLCLFIICMLWCNLSLTLIALSSLSPDLSDGFSLLLILLSIKLFCSFYDAILLLSRDRGSCASTVGVFLISLSSLKVIELYGLMGFSDAFCFPPLPWSRCFWCFLFLSVGWFSIGLFLLFWFPGRFLAPLILTFIWVDVRS